MWAIWECWDGESLVNKNTQPIGSLGYGVYLCKTVDLLVKGEVQTKLNISQIKAFRWEILDIYYNHAIWSLKRIKERRGNIPEWK